MPPRKQAGAAPIGASKQKLRRRVARKQLADEHDDMSIDADNASESITVDEVPRKKKRGRPRRSDTSPGESITPASAKQQRKQSIASIGSSSSMLKQQQKRLPGSRSGEPSATPFIFEFVQEQLQSPGYMDYSWHSGNIVLLYLKNFMSIGERCFAFSPNINFVTGVNGAGKSAIMNAIALCLGNRKLSDTNNYKPKTYIRREATEAEISVVVCNQEPSRVLDRRLPPQFESLVHIQMIIPSGPIRYQLFEIVSEKLQEPIGQSLADITNLMSRLYIQIDNPLTMMTQDKCRSFLNVTNGEKLYELYNAATYMKSLYERYKELVQSTTNARQVVEAPGGETSVQGAERKDLKTRLKAYESVDSDRLQAQHYERVLKLASLHGLRSKLARKETEARKHRDDLAVISARTSNADMQKLDDKIHTLKGKLDQLKNELKELDTVVIVPPVDGNGAVPVAGEVPVYAEAAATDAAASALQPSSSAAASSATKRRPPASSKANQNTPSTTAAARSRIEMLKAQHACCTKTVERLDKELKVLSYRKKNVERDIQGAKNDYARVTREQCTTTTMQQNAADRSQKLKQIDDFQAEIASTLTQRDALERELADMRLKKQECHAEKSSVERDLSDKKSELQRVESEYAEARDELVSRRRMLSQQQRAAAAADATASAAAASRATAAAAADTLMYMYSARHVAVRKRIIDQLDKFHYPPVGPIGHYLRLRQPPTNSPSTSNVDWLPVVQQALGGIGNTGMLAGYICHSSNDRALLEQIFSQVGLTGRSHPKIFTGGFGTYSYNTDAFMPRARSNFQAVDGYSTVPEYHVLDELLAFVGDGVLTQACASFWSSRHDGQAKVNELPNYQQKAVRNCLLDYSGTMRKIMCANFDDARFLANNNLVLANRKSVTVYDSAGNQHLYRGSYTFYASEGFSQRTEKMHRFDPNRSRDQEVHSGITAASDNNHSSQEEQMPQQNLNNNNTQLEADVADKKRIMDAVRLENNAQIRMLNAKLQTGKNEISRLDADIRRCENDIKVQKKIREDKTTAITNLHASMPEEINREDLGERIRNRLDDLQQQIADKESDLTGLRDSMLSKGAECDEQTRTKKTLEADMQKLEKERKRLETEMESVRLEIAVLSRRRQDCTKHSEHDRKLMKDTDTAQKAAKKDCDSLTAKIKATEDLVTRMCELLPKSSSNENSDARPAEGDDNASIFSLEVTTKKPAQKYADVRTEAEVERLGLELIMRIKNSFAALNKKIAEQDEKIQENDHAGMSRKDLWEKLAKIDAEDSVKTKKRQETLETITRLMIHGEALRKRSTRRRDAVRTLMQGRYKDMTRMHNIEGILEFSTKEKGVDKKPVPVINLLCIPQHMADGRDVSTKAGALGVGSKLANKATTMSGGEQSISAACFLAAMWSNTFSPLRMCDEPDVFMDEHNRRKAMEVLLEIARNTFASQTFFITPHDIRPEWVRPHKDRLFRLDRITEGRIQPKTGFYTAEAAALEADGDVPDVATSPLSEGVENVEPNSPNAFSDIE